MPTTTMASFHARVRSSPVRLEEVCRTTSRTGVAPLAEVPVVSLNRKNLLWLTVVHAVLLLSESAITWTETPRAAALTSSSAIHCDHIR